MKFNSLAFIFSLYLIFGKTFSVNIITRLSVGEECGEILNEFSQLLPQFIRCSILNARPFSVCENCVHFYDNVTSIYAKLVSTKDNSSRSCEEVLLNVDRIQVVRQLYNSIISLWQQSKCSRCFAKEVDEQGHAIYVLSNETITFNKYAAETLKCIEDIQKKEPIHGHPKNGTVCQKCQPQYNRLNSYYISLGEVGDSLCMDIVDKMNASRILWSQHLRCVQHNNRVTGIYISATCVCLAPLLFYLLAWRRSTKQEECIIPQKRLMLDQSTSTVVT